MVEGKRRGRRPVGDDQAANSPAAPVPVVGVEDLPRRYFERGFHRFRGRRCEQRRPGAVSDAHEVPVRADTAVFGRGGDWEWEWNWERDWGGGFARPEPGCFVR